MHLLKAIGICLISFSSLAFAQRPERTIEKTIDSEFLNRPMKLHIQLPRGYFENEQKYKVVYYVDGGPQNQDLINGFLEAYTAPAERTKLITVGINTGPDRMYFFTPTEVKNAEVSSGRIFRGESGGGTLLLQCIQKEIIPWVESTYRADFQDRTLMGASAAGVFCFYTLLQPGQPFKNFIVCSGGHLTWDNDLLFKLESELSQSIKHFPVNIYASRGSDDHAFLIPHLDRFIEQLSSSAYEGMNLHYQVNQGADHLTNKWATYPMGLSWVLTQMEAVK